MDNGTPTLEVGFEIGTGGSYEELRRLQEIMNSTETKAVQSAQKMERTLGDLKLGGSAATMTAFASTTSAAFNKAEQAADRMTTRLREQAATFGMTRAAAAAWRAEQLGATDAADKLRQAEAALSAVTEQDAKATRDAAIAYQLFEAAARKGAAAMREVEAAERTAALETQGKEIREAAWAYQMFEAAARKGAAAMREQAAAAQSQANATAAAQVQRLAREHDALAAAVRGSQAAEVADAAAAERLRAATDPLYAATKRLNAEIAESTRLYHVGATAPAEYARQQQVLSGQLAATTTQHTAMAKAGAGNARSMSQLALQLPDIAQGLLTGQKPLTVFIQQGGQLAQVAMMAEGGIKGMALAIGRLTLALSPLIVVAGVGFGAFKLFQKQVENDGSLTRYRDTLGLTHKEMLQLSDGVDKAGDKIANLGKVTITAGDMMSGIWKTVQDDMGKGTGFDDFQKGAVAAFKKVLDGWNVVSAGITAGIYGTFNIVKTVWNSFPAVFGDLFVQGVNAAIAALNGLVKKGVDLLNSFIAAASKATGMNFGAISAPQIGLMDNANAGAAAKAAKEIGNSYTKAYDDALKADAKFWARSGDNARNSAMKRIKDQADAIKADRTPTKPKVDRNALNAEATEAEIRNLYKLADAYGVSGAAALMAEARVKAESQAIKSRGDVEAAVARQIALAVAQRVVDAAKGTAAMRDQTAVQLLANAAVAEGRVPAEQAAEFIRNRMADLPLLAAIEAAQASKNAAGAAAATKALQNQRDARDQLTDSERKGQLAAAMATGANRLAELNEELRLIGATDAARVHALATLRATQDATAKGFGGQGGLDYIVQQEKIADLQVQQQLRTDAYNASLSHQADLLDLIAQNMQTAGQGMADAFGKAGQALGDLTSGFTNYLASQERLKVARTAELKAASQISNVEVRARREQQITAQYAARSATAQIGAFGDMASAAKGFFKEKSTGYKIMEGAEKAYRAIEFAMSVKSMVQNALETLGVVTNSAVKATAKGTEGIASQSSLPFPFNIAAMAATAGALIAAGISVIGGFGGGGSNTLPKANDGTGTVLGDSSAKSDSIKNAINALKDVDTLTNTYARTMSASLKSIDAQIGGFAAQIVRAGNVNASEGVTEGFKPNAIGSILSHIPLIGGLLGSLFGSKTTVVGSGLYGAQQSVGSILNGGYDAQYYSDVQKKKKFLGITTSTSYSTKYSAADPGLENQFTLILKSFNDSIAAAAGPLGVATSDVQARLNGFIVNIGKIDLTGLSGTEIQDKLSAVFGAAADGMANAAFPAIAQFQKVGEGAFETLVRVASTLEAVSASLDLLGNSAQGMSMGAKLGLADQFDSVSALTDAASGYFSTYYSKAERAAAQTAQMNKVFSSLGLSMPATLVGFRQLVEAQDLNTTAGQATYATLLKLAPAFADLQGAIEGVKSAADVASEKLDLQRQLLELQGDTAAIRALEFAKLDESNRGLQQQIWAVQDAKAAADAAKQLSDAWTSVGDSILAEVNRIRGISDASGGTSFSSLMGQFNAATSAARSGDQDAAKSLPGLSQALLTAAGNAATSRQELDRIQAQTAASLEATYGVINSIKLMGTPSTASTLSDAAVTAQAAATPAAANDDMASEIRALRDELSQLRADNNAGQATIASNTGRIAKKLDDVTGASGGDAISVASAA